MKQILSPADLPNQEVPSGPVQRYSSSPVADSVDEVPTAQSISETSDNVGHLDDIGKYQSGASDVGDGLINDVANDDEFQNDGAVTNVQSESPVQTGSILQPTVGRPKRDRKPNVKYSAEEYELAQVSASGKLLLSGLNVKEERLKNRGRC